MWGKIVHRRTEGKSYEEDNHTKGEHIPISVAIPDRGGGPEAIEAIQFFVAKVRSLPAEERAKYLGRDEWTNEVTVAIPRKGWQEGSKRKWEISEHADDTADQPSSSASTLAATTTGTVPPTDNKAHPKAKAKVAAAKKQRVEEVPPATEPEGKKDDPPKTAAQVWKHILKTKEVLEGAINHAAAHTRQAEQSGGAWVKALDEFAEVRSVLAAIEAKLHVSAFWHLLTTQPLADMKRKYPKVADLNVENAMLSKLDDLRMQLETANATLYGFKAVKASKHAVKDNV